MVAKRTALILKGGVMLRIARFLPIAVAIGLSAVSVPAKAATVLWANVNANGTLARGEGAVQAQRTAKGAYLVTFNRNVARCNYGISLYRYGMAFTKPSVAAQTDVFIGIIDNLSKDNLDTSFYLQVICR